MFGVVARTELRRQLTHPLTLFASLFVALIAFNDIHLTGPTASGLIRIGRTAHDAPLVAVELVAAVIVPGLFLVALMVGPCVQRDFAHRSTPFFFTTPLDRTAYLGGRFVGATVATLALPAAALLGMAAAWAVLPPEHLGGLRPGGPVQAVAFAVPTLLAFAALYFCLATLTRSMVATYVAAVLTMLLVFVVQGMASELLTRGEVTSAPVRWLLLLGDPTGRAPLALETSTWSLVERSRRLVPPTLPLVANRALWCAVAVGLLGWTWSRFRIEHPREAAPAVRDRSSRPSVPRERGATRPAPAAAAQSGPPGRTATLARLTRVELLRTVGHPAFLVLAAGMAVQLASNFIGNVHAANLLPRTGFLVNQGLAAIDAPAIMMTLFFVGTIAWRERETGEAAIADALPVSDAMRVASRFAALAALQALYAGLVIGVALFAQVAIFGYTDVEPGLYVRAVLGIHLLGWMQIAAGMLLLQTVAPSRTWGFAFCGAAVLWAAVAPALGLSSTLLRYGAVPRFVYSEMNGFGPFATGLVAYRALWTALAVLALIAAASAWPRGPRRSAGATLRRLLPASPTGRLAFVATFLIAVAIGTLLGFARADDTPRLAGRATGAELRARYEALARPDADLAQPIPTALDLRVELFPRRRAADVSGLYTLTNRGETPIDRLLLTLLATRLSRPPVYRLDRPVRGFGGDPRAGLTAIDLDTPLGPGETLRLSFEVHAVGLPPGSDAPLALVRNGSVVFDFVGDASFVPLLGYRDELELRDPALRARHGLVGGPTPVLAPDDPAAGRRASRARIRFSATVGTDADQVVVAPGRLDRTWTEGERRMARYVVTAPMFGEFAVVSGRYEVARTSAHGVEIELFHDRDRTATVERMLAGLRAGMEAGIERFGPYPHGTLRVVEVPAYGVVDGTAISKPGLVVWNESGGFLDAPPRTGEIDPVFSTAVHETAHQWWAHQVRPAFGVAGALTLNETLAQYLRLTVLQDRYDAPTIERFLDDERRAYLILRAGSAREEHPLVSTAENEVAYRKGTLAMAALSDALGRPAMDAALRGLADRFALRGPPYPTTRDLVDALRAVAPPGTSELLHEWLETISFVDARLVEASSRSVAGGGTHVHVELEIRKYREDGRGNRREVAFRGDVGVRVEDADGRPLLETTVTVDGPRAGFDLAVDGRPATVVLDPRRHQLDADRDDNDLAIVPQRRAPN